MEYDNIDANDSLEEAVANGLISNIDTTSGIGMTSGNSLIWDTDTTTQATWVYDGTTTSPTAPATDQTVTIGGTYGNFSGSTIYQNASGSWQQFPIEFPKATKDELKKIIKNTEVQIEIDGETKIAKLSDLLETGYLKLKQL